MTIEIPGSLRGANLRPVCDDHQPVVDLVCIGIVQIYCEHCGFRMVMGVATYMQLLDEEGD